MSPEQLRGEPLTASSDLYSLGALLYQLTTGVCPFTGELTQLINDKLNAPVPLPSIRHRPWPYHAALEALILNLMSRNPSARFQSAGEVLALLHNAQSKEAPLPQTPSSAPWLTQTSPAEQANPSAPRHLAFDTADVEVTASDTLRALEPEDLEPFKPQAVITRRPTAERAKRASEARPRSEWVGNLLWLCIGATLAIFMMRWLG
jgi:serine/threonine protein kinase